MERIECTFTMGGCSVDRSPSHDYESKHPETNKQTNKHKGGANTKGKKEKDKSAERTKETERDTSLYESNPKCESFS